MQKGGEKKMGDKKGPHGPVGTPGPGKQQPNPNQPRQPK